MLNRPNILFIIVDEWRYPVAYESEELKQWKKENLKFYETLSGKGSVFHRHYTNTNACVPARTTIQTSVYPLIHGNKSTDAVAKTTQDFEMKWLPPFTVPTMGNYFRKAGYKTILKGKWHITDASITGLSGDHIATFDIDGNRLKDFEDFYLEEDVLNSYGYSGWIGPEPHGRMSLNTASSVPRPKIGRDESFVNQTLETLTMLNSSETPWLLNLNLVDPHDIVIFGQLSAKATVNFEFLIDSTLPEILFTKDFDSSFLESLISKPPTQREYRDMYENIFQPLFHIDTHIRYYYTLMKRADDQLMRIWNKLLTMSSYNNTIIVFTSDHGELLGSHGGMQQKWFQAYDEAIRIPLIIASPLFNHKHQDIYELTSHIDLLPTFLDMAGINLPKIRHKLSQKFSLAVPLSGSSIFPLITNKNKYESRPVYFYTEDNPTKGNNQVNVLRKRYLSIPEPCCVEAILAYLDGYLWKYTTYYSLDPLFVNNGINHELYNISIDPLELHNLHNILELSQIETKLNNLLLSYSFRFRSSRNISVYQQRFQ